MNKFDVDEKINKWITGILITIFIGYFFEAIMGIYFLIEMDSYHFRNELKKYLKLNILPTFIAFMIILSLFIILLLYIIKDNYEINELNKNLILIGIPIILGYYLFIPIFKNLYIGSLLKNKQNSNACSKFNFSKDIGKYSIFTNFFNLTLLISIFYSIYWNNWDITSWKKWLICIGSILGFNLLVFSISLALMNWNGKKIDKKFNIYGFFKKFFKNFSIKQPQPRTTTTTITTTQRKPLDNNNINNDLGNNQQQQQQQTLI